MVCELEVQHCNTDWYLVAVQHLARVSYSKTIPAIILGASSLGVALPLAEVRQPTGSQWQWCTCLCNGKTIPGIILGVQSPGAALPLAGNRQPTGSQWQCCTWLLVWQNNTRYYFGCSKSRCSIAIGKSSSADRQPMAVLHLAFAIAKLYPVLFWVYQVQVQHCHWPNEERQHLAIEGA